MVIPCQYEDALFFSDGIAIVCQEGKYGAINKIGEMIIPFQYDYSLKTLDCLVILNQNGGYELVDSQRSAGGVFL